MIKKIFFKAALDLYRVPSIEITCMTSDSFIGSVDVSYVSKLIDICLDRSLVVLFNGLDGNTRLFFKVKDNLPF